MRTEYELNQESSRGITLPYPGTYGYHYYLSILLFLGCFTVFVLIVTSINLATLYRANPDYRSWYTQQHSDDSDLIFKQALCDDIDQTFVSTKYVLDETDLICKPVEAEAQRAN